MCPHISDEMIRTGILDGIKQGMREFSEYAGALTVVRNGGNELAFKSFMLGRIEEHTKCFAFTESDRRRVDATLRCADCGEARGIFEFKHNFLSQAGTHVPRERRDAISKLSNKQSQGCLGFYVHVVVELKGHHESRLAKIHNEVPGLTKYKRFLSESERSNLMKILVSNLGQSALKSCEISAPDGDNSGSVLHCWLFELRDGELVPSANVQLADRDVQFLG